MEEVKWEMIKSDFRRYKCFGGWIVNSYTVSEDCGCCESMCFVPDPKHEWEIR